MPQHTGLLPLRQFTTHQLYVKDAHQYCKFIPQLLPIWQIIIMNAILWSTFHTMIITFALHNRERGNSEKKRLLQHLTETQMLHNLASLLQTSPFSYLVILKVTKGWDWTALSGFTLFNFHTTHLRFILMCECSPCDQFGCWLSGISWATFFRISNNSLHSANVNSNIH